MNDFNDKITLSKEDEEALEKKLGFGCLTIVVILFVASMTFLTLRIKGII